MDKIRIVTAALLAACICGLSACSSTGGDIGGLFPAPKFLKGSIGDDNVYTAQDKRFTVSVPFPMDTDDHRYMKVKEVYGPKDDYVSFGPGAVNEKIYRVDLDLPPKGVSLPALDIFAPQVLSIVETQVQQGYGGVITLNGEGTKTKVGGHDAYHWQFRQDVPAKSMGSSQVLTYELYLIDFGWTMATTWVQTPNGNFDSPSLTAEQFAESLKVTAPSHAQ